MVWDPAATADSSLHCGQLGPRGVSEAGELILLMPSWTELSTLSSPLHLELPTHLSSMRVWAWGDPPLLQAGCSTGVTHTLLTAPLCLGPEVRCVLDQRAWQLALAGALPTGLSLHRPAGLPPVVPPTWPLTQAQRLPSSTEGSGSRPSLLWPSAQGPHREGAQGVSRLWRRHPGRHLAPTHSQWPERIPGLQGEALRSTWLGVVSERQGLCPAQVRGAQGLALEREAVLDLD